MFKISIHHFRSNRLYENLLAQAPVTQYVVLSVDAPRDLPARIVDTDADVTMSLGKV